MKEKEFEKITKNINEKLGEENAGLIADDLLLLITDNASTNKELKNKDEEIERLTKDKENLLTVNGNLFQQVSSSISEEDETKVPQETKPKKFDFRQVFDEKRKF